ncbi:MAG: CocE/NonD family hydrolase, partial [Kiloniellales bacterium]|nr:CocE/NonD family hydrolase [Kiloniellales bacterium]
RRRDYTRLRGDEMHRYFAGHGYAGVRVDIRGSGDSDGILEDEYLQQELDDAVAVIDWLARQPWCTGRVGMTGISWGGFNALQVAALRPPPLKAVITACSTDDRYADDVHYMGGCLITENLEWASTMFGFNARPPDPEVVGDRWREMWLERLERQEPWILKWLAHQPRDEVWKHGTVCEDVAAIDCAVYAVGGWADGYSNAIPRLLAGLTCPRKGLIGPWSHAWPYAAKPGPAIGYLQEALRWWDHWLKGEDTGIMNEPMLRVWMQESVPPAPQYLERPGRWVAEPAWPSPNVEPRPWALNAGRLDDAAEPEAALVHRSPQSLGLTAGEWCPYGYEAEMPTDQRLEDGQCLSFDSAPLDERLEILGAPEAELEIAVNRPTAFLALRLNDVAPDGAATQVTYGLLNLTHDAAHETVTALEPGRRIRARVRLNDIAHAFPEGHRIRLAVSTSYWPRVWPSPEPVTLTLYAGASHLHLPVRPPRTEDAALADFAEPQASPPGPHRVLSPAHRGRGLEQDFATGETVVETVKDRGRVQLHDIDLTIGGGGIDRFTLMGDDPLSARHENRYRISLERGDWRIRTEADTVMTCTKDDFLVSAQLDAYEGDTRVFSRCWTRRIPRDG